MTARTARTEARVAEIGQYRVLTDPPRRELVALADVAAQVAGVPMATINLITDTEQHQVATVGFDPSVCTRADSMCNAVFQHGEPVVVPDARESILELALTASPGPAGGEGGGAGAGPAPAPTEEVARP